jgi:hypothetical protein
MPAGAAAGGDACSVGSIPLGTPPEQLPTDDAELFLEPVSGDELDLVADLADEFLATLEDLAPPPPAPAASNIAPAGPAADPMAAAAPEPEDLPPPVLPEGLTLRGIVDLVVMHPDLAAYDLVSILLGHSRNLPVSPSQLNILRMVVDTVIMTEQRGLQAAAVNSSMAAASGGDQWAVLMAGLGRLLLPARRPAFSR